MPRMYVSKGVLQVDRTNLKKAFYHRVETGCSLREAAQMYDVKLMTLQDAFARSKKKSDGQTFVPLMHTASRVFSPEQENQIIEYTKKLAQMFYGLDIAEFLKLIYMYAIAVGSKAIPKSWEKWQSASRDWYYAFIKRNPSMSLKIPEGMSIPRTTTFNRTNVDLFFKVYTEAVDKYSFTPDRIFNLDESNLTNVMKPVKVVCKRSPPLASQISRESGASMTFVGIICASGTFLPPLFLIPPKRWNDSFTRETISESKGLPYQNGWMNGALFVETLKHIKSQTDCSPDNKILLIMDNAEWHMNIHAVEYAIENGIVIVTLPPHTTTRHQPLDVSVFGPFKSKLRALQQDFCITNINTLITEHNLIELACKAWLKACTPANVMNGFAAAGIWPIDCNIIPDEAYAGSEVTEQLPSEIAAVELELDMSLDAALHASPSSSALTGSTAASSDVSATGPSGFCSQGSSSDSFKHLDLELEVDLDTLASYPFQQEEPEVGDFILCSIPLEEGPKEEGEVYYVARVLGFTEEALLNVSLLGVKSSFTLDNLTFPAIKVHSTEVIQEQCQDVLTTRKDSTQDQANLVKAVPPLDPDFNVR